MQTDQLKHAQMRSFIAIIVIARLGCYTVNVAVRRGNLGGKIITLFVSLHLTILGTVKQCVMQPDVRVEFDV